MLKDGKRAIFSAAHALRAAGLLNGPQTGTGTKEGTAVYAVVPPGCVENSPPRGGRLTYQV